MSPCRCAEKAHHVVAEGTGIRCVCGVAGPPEVVVDHVKTEQARYTERHHGRRHAHPA